jgi:hypothetical protein
MRAKAMSTVKELKIGGAVPKRGADLPAEAGTATSKAQINGASDSNDLMPLDFLLAGMRDQYLPLPMKAAKAAAPYCHSKLASIQPSSTVGMSHEECLKALAGDVADCL